MDINSAWDRIEAWLSREAPEVLPSLRPGVTDEQVRRFESANGLTLPADVRTSALRHDGQSDDGVSGLVPYSTRLGPAPAWRLLPLTEVERRRADMKSLVDIGEFAGQKGTPPAGEQTEWWSLEWAPLAEDGGGDLVCLDSQRSDGDRGGRIIVFHHDSPRREVLAPSFGQWLDSLANQMEAGRYHFDPDEWGLMEVEVE